jgi:serine/threonine-protein kinase
VTEVLLTSLTPVAAGRTGPRSFAVSMVGPEIAEARHVVEMVTAQVRGSLPEPFELAATLVSGSSDGR